MKRNLRVLSLIIILTLTFQLIPHISTDINGTNNSALDTKSIINEFSLQGKDLLFTLDNEKAKRLSATGFNAIFGTRSSMPANFLSQLSSRKTHIDIRQKIRDVLTCRFYGSKYIISNLLI